MEAFPNRGYFYSFANGSGFVYFVNAGMLLYTSYHILRYTNTFSGVDTLETLNPGTKTIQRCQPGP